MGGLQSRNKGKSGEREIALVFIGAMRQVEFHLGITQGDERAQSSKVERNLQQSASGGHDIVGIPFYAVEVKKVDKPVMKAYWEQAMEQAKRVKLKPLLAWKAGRADWRVRFEAITQSGDAIVCDANLMEWIATFQNDYYRLLMGGSQ